MPNSPFPVYISFDAGADDDVFAAFDLGLKALAKKRGRDIEICGYTREPDTSQAEWEKILEESISEALMLIVLLGQGTHKSELVSNEILIAKYSLTPIMAVYPENNPAEITLPRYVQPNRAVSWNFDDVCNALWESLLTESEPDS